MPLAPLDLILSLNNLTDSFTDCVLDSYNLSGLLALLSTTLFLLRYYCVWLTIFLLSDF